MFSGISNTFSQFGQWYLDQAKQAMPFVIAQPGNKVYILLQDGVSLGIDVKEM